jgi:hypothetical protein
MVKVKGAKISGGWLKKGGINPPPTSPKPVVNSITPQKPSKSTSKKK